MNLQQEIGSNGTGTGMARVQDLFGSIYNICISLLVSLDALTFFLAYDTSTPALAGLAFWIGFVHQQR